MTETAGLRGAMWEEYFWPTSAPIPDPRATSAPNLLRPKRLILLDEPQRTLATYLSSPRKRAIQVNRLEIQITSEPKVSKRAIQV